MALKNSVHQIAIYNVIVTGSTVMDSRDDGGEIGDIFVHLSLKLQDFQIEWPGCSTHFILLYRFLETFSPITI